MYNSGETAECFGAFTLVATTPARIVLFLSSYSPLFVILGLRNSFGNDDVSFAFYAIALGSIMFLFLYIRTNADVTPDSIKIKSVSSRDADVMSYIVSYLLPFLDISFKDIPNAISLGILIAVIAIIYIKSNMVYVNPILNLAGYHLFEVESESGKVSALICKQSYVRAGSSVDAVPLGDFALLEREKKRH